MKSCLFQGELTTQAHEGSAGQAGLQVSGTLVGRVFSTSWAWVA